MTDKKPSDAILCAGRLYCDLVFTGAPNMPSLGTETFCDGLSLHAGGGAFITGAAFSALGWNCALLSTLPAAPFDAVVAEDIARFHIDTSICAKADTDTAPQLTVAITGKDDRAFLSHKAGKALPNADLSKIAFKHLHIGELRSLIEHPDLIAKARDAGATISVDCGWDEALMAHGSSVAELLSQVDVFLPNETEFRHLTSSGLAECDLPLTVVKCGENGAKALYRGEWISEPTIQTEVVDTTGAGDAFNGGFLSGWLLNLPVFQCLKEGNRCGSASIQHPGGTGGLAQLHSDTTAPEARVGS